MTSINVTTTKNTVTVNEGDTTVVNVSTQGPQGESFSTTGTIMNDSAKVNNSVVIFHQASGTFKADATRTVENLVDWGNY